MSLPKIPDLNPDINIERKDAINILIVSIGLEELALAHIMNAEGEKIQYVLGTLEGSDPGEVNISDVMRINDSVNKTLRNVIKTEMLLQFKLEDAIELEDSGSEPEPEPETFTVTYMAGDGGIGGPARYTDIPSGTSYTVRTLQEVGISPISPEYEFAGWMTIDGIYYPGRIIVVNSNITLTAIWKEE